MSVIYCPDCAYPHRLMPERDDDGELIGFECERCHGFFEDAEDEEPGHGG